jgi:hypothetical protein
MPQGYDLFPATHRGPSPEGSMPECFRIVRASIRSGLEHFLDLLLACESKRRLREVVRRIDCLQEAIRAAHVLVDPLELERRASGAQTQFFFEGRLYRSALEGGVLFPEFGLCVIGEALSRDSCGPLAFPPTAVLTRLHVVRRRLQDTFGLFCIARILEEVDHELGFLTRLRREKNLDPPRLEHLVQRLAIVEARVESLTADVESSRTRNAPAGPKPHWDASKRRLRYGELVCKEFRQPARRQVTILEHFEKAGWPPSIETAADGATPDRGHQTGPVCLGKAEVRALSDIRWSPSGRSWRTVQRRPDQPVRL